MNQTQLIEERLRGAFNSFDLHRLSLEARGTLWTMIVYNNIPLKESCLEHILDSRWPSLLSTLTAFKLGTITKNGDTLTFKLSNDLKSLSSYWPSSKW